MASSDVVELAKELRSERLFVQSEIESLRSLNRKLEQTLSDLAQATWRSAQQRFAAKQLVAQADSTSPTCCRKVESVPTPVFVDAHEVLRYQDALVLSAVIRRVRVSPAVASLWLASAETSRPAASAAVARVLCSGLYVGDVSSLRRVLRYLARHHLARLEDPLRKLNDASSSFMRLYCELVDGFRPARLFLAAALQMPILTLLQIDHCLIVDPEILMERMKKPNNSNTNNNLHEQLYKYRNRVLSDLILAAENFIRSLRDTWVCFPPTIAWVVRQTALALQSNQKMSEADIYSISIHLVFKNFICRAIINPEAYGIIDIPINNICRLNLVQIAIILEKLCSMKYQEVNGKLRDLYSRFEKDSIFTLLDMLLENVNYSTIPNDGLSSNESENYDLDDAISEDMAETDEKESLKTVPVVHPNIALFTRQDLQLLVSLLKNIPIATISNFDLQNEHINNGKLNNFILEGNNESLAEKKKQQKPEQNVAENVSQEKLNEDNNSSTNSVENELACGISNFSNDAIKNDTILVDPSQNEGLYHLLQSINPEQITKLQKLLKRLPDSKFNRENNSNQNTTASVKGKSHIGGNSPVKNGPKNKNIVTNQSNEVLIIKFPNDNAYENIGLLPEHKVLEYHYSTLATDHILTEGILQNDPEISNDRSMELVDLPLQEKNDTTENILNDPTSNEVVGSNTGQEKRTRFSLSHDEGSIGNTSDNLEAVSEAASNHSVTSSLEMETEDQNDNLSDMVSANVSGRGSPNISGRDTPSSQVTEGDAGVANSQPIRQPSVITNSTSASKQAKLLKRTRHDIEDKFCKFEIKKLLEGDETISIISDTWSTDVLASDSETIGESIYERNFIASALSQQSIIPGAVSQAVVPLAPPSQPDASETASESAWSTDALVSESDRMTEVDMDDCNSVTRSEIDTSQYEEGTSSNTIAALQQLSPIDNLDSPNNRHISTMRISRSNLTSASPLASIGGTVLLNKLENTSTHEDEKNNNLSNICLNKSASVTKDSKISTTSTNSCHNKTSDTKDNAQMMNKNGQISGHAEIEKSNLSIQDKPRYKSKNGYTNGSTNLNLELNLDHAIQTLCNQQPASDTSGDSNFSSYNGSGYYVSEINKFNIELQDSLNNTNKIVDSEASSSNMDIISDNNTPSIQTVNKATSLWLNDPSQKFPIRPECKQQLNKFSSIDYDLISLPSCSTNNLSKGSFNSLCKNMEKLSMLHSECEFRPIKTEDNILTADNFIKKVDEPKPSLENAKKELELCNNLQTKSINSTYEEVIFLSQPEFCITKAIQDDINLSKKNHFDAVTPIECIPSKSNTEINSIFYSASNSQINNSLDTPLLNQSIIKGETFNNIIPSGSAISLSTLSVNSGDTSISDKSSSQDINSENMTELKVTPPLSNSIANVNETKNSVWKNSAGNDGANILSRPNATSCSNASKPGPSTGAIPKSISFDATAEKSHRYSGRKPTDDSSEAVGLNFVELKNNMKRSGGIFLNKIKMFRGKSKGLATSVSNSGKRSNVEDCSDDIKITGDTDLLKNQYEENIKILPNSVKSPKYSNELSDDILAKYRRKISSSGDIPALDSSNTSGSNRIRNRNSIGRCEPSESSLISSDKHSDLGLERLTREMRLVLSHTDVHNVELTPVCTGSTGLECTLRLISASGAAGAASALEGLLTLDKSCRPLLLSALGGDSAVRRPYMVYLTKCRKSLLSAISALESEHLWQESEISQQRALAAATKTRNSLAAREAKLVELQEKLRSGLIDERRDALFASLDTLSSEITAEDTWADASDLELEQVSLTIERVVMSRVYMQTMFPNGEGDFMRDQLLHDHMKKLGTNSRLPIPHMREFLWIPAQRILSNLFAYQSPRDKVLCIVRCVNNIMSLLTILSNGVPGADDLTPVLVYVLIKANPPSLLSTVQFVTNFRSSIEGEELYCWTQFCAAIEYIKTLD